MKMKKGVMLPATVVKYLVFILAFAIIIYIILTYPFEGTIDKEACHKSIILRSSFNYEIFEPGKAIPLRCKTEQVCLTKDDYDCEEEFREASRENPVTEVKLNKDVDKARKEIKDAIADSMYDCHSMLGEGKLDFMPHSFYQENYCLICSRVVFDEKAKDEIGSITYGEIYQYLQEKETPQGQSYLEYIHPNWENWENSKKLFASMQAESDNQAFKDLKFEDWKIDFREEKGYAIIAQMAPEATWQEWVGGGLTAVIVTAAVVITATGIGAPIGIGLIVGAAEVGIVSGGAVFWYSHPNEKYKYSPPSIHRYNIEVLRGLKCTSFETAS